MRPQISAGMLQPAFIGPGGAGVAVDDGLRLLPGAESEAGVARQLSEIAAIGRAKRRFLAPAVGIFRLVEAGEVSDTRIGRRRGRPPEISGDRACYEND